MESADLGVEFQQSIAIMSDASAAIGISNRIGIGKIRHIEVTQCGFKIRWPTEKWSFSKYLPKAIWLMR